jgi:hypothetical protein
MTINKDRFSYWLAAIGDRMTPPKVLTPPTIAEYYKLLSPRMTTPEFEVMAAKLFAETTYFPRPADFLPPQAPNLAGAAVYEKLRELAEKSPRGSYWRRETIEARLNYPAAVAFSAVGGNDRFRSTEAADEHWLRRDFIAAYAEAEQYDAHAEDVGRAIAAATGSNYTREVRRPRSLADFLPKPPSAPLALPNPETR